MMKEPGRQREKVEESQREDDGRQREDDGEPGRQREKVEESQEGREKMMKAERES